MLSACPCLPRMVRSEAGRLRRPRTAFASRLTARVAHGRRLAGVTMVELMTALTISSIVLAFGAPAAGQWLRDVEIRSSASALLAALQAARAEAIARNAPVRLRLVDALGRPGWEVGCVRVSARCPATIRRQPVSAATDVRWGASLPAGMPALTAAITAGAGLPAGVTFDALGAAAAVGSGGEIARIDITHARGAEARRLVILIAAQGMARLCDPLAATDRPERCQ